MSNYNTQLQSNNTDLQALINKANALPDAVNIDAELTEQDTLISQIQAVVDSLPEAGSSSGGSVETVTITISSIAPFGVAGTLYYIDKFTSLQSLVATAGQVEVLKNTLMLAVSGGEGISSNTLPKIYSELGVCILYQATQDGTIKL